MFLSGVRLQELRNQFRNNRKFQIIPLESVRGRLRECVNTEFLWEFKLDFVKAAKSTAVRLREYPLRELGP